jgi:uncharacterized protein YnzC (UPF0291/DUF896 family)
VTTTGCLFNSHAFQVLKQHSAAIVVSHIKCIDDDDDDVSNDELKKRSDNGRMYGSP